MQRAIVVVTVFLAASVLTCSGGNNHDAGPSDAAVDLGPPPIYGGTASDELWRNMIDARDRTTENATKGGTFTYPTEGATVPAASPATFSFTRPLAWNSEQPLRRHDRPMIDLFSTAYAHGQLTTGNVSWVFFHIPGHDDVVLLTSEATWTPDAATWEKLKAAGSVELSAEIITAYVLQDHVQDGPYKAPGVRRFHIQ